MDNKEVVKRIEKHSRKILEYIKDLDFDEFMSNELVQEACVFNIAQIGELTSMLEETFMSEHDEIPWRAMKGLRNRIVHDYDGVNFQIVWDTINSDFPQMLTQLEKITKEDL